MAGFPTTPVSRSALGERFSGDRPMSCDAANRWSPLTPLPEARSGRAAAIVDGTLHAMGEATLAGGMESAGRVDPLAL